MGLLLWGCKSAATTDGICTFSKSNKTVHAIVRADFRDGRASLPTKIGYVPSPSEQSDGAPSDVPADDDDSAVGKVLPLPGIVLPATLPEKNRQGWRYATAYLPPVRPAVTPPPPQA